MVGKQIHLDFFFLQKTCFQLSTCPRWDEQLFNLLLVLYRRSKNIFYVKHALFATTSFCVYVCVTPYILRNLVTTFTLIYCIYKFKKVAWLPSFVVACVRSFVWSSLDSIHSVRFGQLLRCAHKRIVNIMKGYMERKNRQLELIRFRKKYRIYSRLLFRTDEVNATRVFTLGWSLQHKHVR